MRLPILAVSDIHFHTYKAHSRLIDGVNSRLLDQIDAWRQAVEVGVANGCGLMLLAGDVFEVRGSIKPSVFNRVSGLVMETLSKGLDMGVIPGNHDLEHFGATESAIESWDYLKARSNGRLKKCRVFKAPGLYNLAGYTILGIPYMHDVDIFKETFQRLSADMQPDITMIHQGIDNFNHSHDYPITGITAEWLEDHNPGTIVCGHYHRPGQSAGGRVVNVGALVQHRFSDEGCDRGCWIISERSIKFVKVASPRFVTVESPTQVERDFSRVFVRIRTKSEKDAQNLRKMVIDAGALSVRVEIEKEFKTAHEKTISIASPRAMLVEYLDLVKRYRGRKEEIVNLFDRICVD